MSYTVWCRDTNNVLYESDERADADEFADDLRAMNSVPLNLEVFGDDE